MIFSFQELSAQENDTSYSNYSKNSAIVQIAVLESVIFGMSSISYINYGSEYLGVVYGGSSIAILTLTTMYNLKSEDHQQKIKNYSFIIPYSIGLAALSYYNFKYSNEHSKPQRFWNNVIGLNASLVASLATVFIVDKCLLKKNISLSLSKNRISLSYRF